jgi:cytochrome c oxidase subunit 2
MEFLYILYKVIEAHTVTASQNLGNHVLAILLHIWTKVNDKLYIIVYGIRSHFQEPVTAIMEGIIELHHEIMYYMIVVVALVFWMMRTIVKYYGWRHYVYDSYPFSYYHEVTTYWYVFYIPLSLRLLKLKRQYFPRRSLRSELVDIMTARHEFKHMRQVLHGQVLEIVWTITPSFVLVGIAIPSFALLYSMDELVEPMVTLKVIGYQWYWSYEYINSKFEDLKFDSYMITEDSLQVGDRRLLEVDNKVWVPVDTPVRVIVTAADVLHCWALPALGVKMDCVPGRLNQTGFFAKQTGIFYGQCSELCGVNHGFMPICLKIVPDKLFNMWLESNFKK